MNVRWDARSGEGVHRHRNFCDELVEMVLLLLLGVADLDLVLLLLLLLLPELALAGGAVLFAVAFRADETVDLEETLRDRVESKLVVGADCCYEIVIDGIDQPSVAAAMRAAIEAAAGEGILEIDAGNYGGKLGKYPIRLHELFA